MPAMTSQGPVYVLIHPDGRAEWGEDISVAMAAMGPHGYDRAPLRHGRTEKLWLLMSDCALLLRDVYPANSHARAVLATVAGLPLERAPETRGPVALWGWDPLNEWDRTRAFSADERHKITEALTAAGCS